LRRTEAISRGYVGEKEKTKAEVGVGWWSREIEKECEPSMPVNKNNCWGVDAEVRNKNWGRKVAKSPEKQAQKSGLGDRQVGAFSVFR